ncbi:MAG TPA: amidohydrolase family protein [Gaiellales bacterium]|nr:amidohydrolase family protein [Gaiellales bacterium]
MAIAAEQGERETLATTFILDGDVHLNELPGELAEYAEAPWDVGLREIAKANGLYLSLPGMAPRAECRVPWPGAQNRSQVVATAADRRRELDELHVDVAVLYPDNLLMLPMLRDELFDGERTAIFASDWPHHDFDHPQHVFGLPFSPEARRAILGGNGARFYGIEIPAQYPREA